MDGKMMMSDELDRLAFMGVPESVLKKYRDKDITPNEFEELMKEAEGWVK